MRVLTIAAALAVTMTAPALAQQSSTAPQAATTTQQQTAAKKPKPRIVCEQQERVGSRLGGHKVCRDVSDAQNNRADTRMQVERAQAMIQAPLVH